MLRLLAASYLRGAADYAGSMKNLSQLETRLYHYCDLVRVGEHSAAVNGIRTDKLLSENEKRSIIAAINDGWLLDQELEWTTHGIARTFRFWSREQKVAYIERANELVLDLLALSPLVSFGFGAVLGFVRDGDLIPHDDDLDTLIAFPASNASFCGAKEQLKKHLNAKGWSVSGDYPSHFNVFRPSQRSIDVFIGFVEDQRVSWFPSRRRNLRVHDVFPTQEFEVLGQLCPIPADPKRYLAATYGENWFEPIANWHHPWDASEYGDFMRRDQRAPIF